MPTEKDTNSFLGKLKRAISQLRYLPMSIRLILAASGKWTGIWLLALVIQGFVPASILYLTRILVDSLVESVNSGGDWGKVQPTVFYASAMILVIIFSELLKNFSSWIQMINSELIQDHMSSIIHDKSTMVDLVFYDSPDYFNQLHRAREEASDKSLSLIENGGLVLQHVISLLGMAAILLPYGFWLPGVLVLSTIPAFYVVVRHTWKYHKWWKSTTSERRTVLYYDSVLTMDTYAAELRLFGLANYFKSAYKNMRKPLRDQKILILRRQSIAKFFASFMSILVSGLTMIWIAWKAFLGTATLGDIALFHQAFSRGQTILQGLLGSLGEIYGNCLFLGNLFEFLSLQPEVRDIKNPESVPAQLGEGIRLRDVVFNYPSSDRMALDDFNLFIPAKKVVAIVGANGAGKSTLLKLLCRLYDPKSGTIEFDGRDIRKFDLHQLRNMISVIFQEPVQYHATASENISMGNLGLSPDIETIKIAAKNAGAHEIIGKLPQGYQTPLGKWLSEGSELSGGEWQRIAMARSFLRRAEIMILDEPTSFMDSWAETKWLERFRTLAKGKTALIITHRFTTAMCADIIHVMDAGQVVESGSHAQLLKIEGLYAQSWNEQIKISERSSKTNSDG